jgi:hypothetical protein
LSLGIAYECGRSIGSGSLSTIKETRQRTKLHRPYPGWDKSQNPFTRLVNICHPGSGCYWDLSVSTLAFAKFATFPSHPCLTYTCIRIERTEHVAQVRGLQRKMHPGVERITACGVRPLWPQILQDECRCRSLSYDLRGVCMPLCYGCSKAPNPLHTDGCASFTAKESDSLSPILTYERQIFPNASSVH